ADERLVRNLDSPFADRDQSCIGQGAEDRVDVVALLGTRRQLCDRDAAARVLGALAELRQPEEDVAGECLLVGCESLPILGFRRLRDRSLDAACLQVADQRQRAIAPSLPRLEQAVRQERQRARLADDVAQDPFDEPRFENEARALRRTLDRPSQLLLAHRPDERLMILERCRKSWVLGAATVKVGPQRDDDARSALGGLEQGVDERPPLVIVTAEREHLLELVNDEEARVSGVGEFGERPSARGEEQRMKRAIAAPKFGHDAGANERRFPTTRSADDRQERGVIEATEEVLHELL